PTTYCLFFHHFRRRSGLTRPARVWPRDHSQRFFPFPRCTTSLVASLGGCGGSWRAGAETTSVHADTRCTCVNSPLASVLCHGGLGLWKPFWSLVESSILVRGTSTTHEFRTPYYLTMNIAPRQY